MTAAETISDFKALLKLLKKAVPKLNHAPNPRHAAAYPDCAGCKLISEAKRLGKKYLA